MANIIETLENLADTLALSTEERNAMNVAIVATKMMVNDCINTPCVNCIHHSINGPVCRCYPQKSDKITTIHEEA
jgi:hypothetical protein